MGFRAWVNEHIFGMGDWCVVYDGNEIYAIPIARKTPYDRLFDYGLSRRAAIKRARYVRKCARQPQARTKADESCSSTPIEKGRARS